MSDSFSEGTLWPEILRATDHALACRSLMPIRTGYEYFEDGGIRFLIRVIDSLARKDRERAQQGETLNSGSARNPFLPHENNLFVSDVSENHIALLNKFNVVENHLLIVTRRFEDQEMLLTEADCEALLLCMKEYDSLGFYNGGMEAGASQRHKHLQVVPLPLCPDGKNVPVEPLLPGTAPDDEPVTVSGLPFQNAFVRPLKRFEGRTPGEAKRLFSLYKALLRHAGLKDTGPLQTAPYCFLMTLDWLLLVPRSQECFGSISINSLGYAGAFLVRTREQMDFLKKTGPLRVLGLCAVGR